MMIKQDDGIHRGVLLAVCALAVAGVAVVAWIEAARSDEPPAWAYEAPQPATMDNGTPAHCGATKVNANGREWIEAGSGCGPVVNDVDYLVLRDGRRCDYVYQPGTDKLLGLWCDVLMQVGP